MNRTSGKNKCSYQYYSYGLDHSTWYYGSNFVIPNIMDSISNDEIDKDVNFEIC